MPHEPWKPTTINDRSTSQVRVSGEVSKADVRAIYRCFQGTATPTQQKQAMEAIIQGICRVDDLGYYPGGSEGERDTNFSQGMRHAGLQLKKFCLHGNQLTKPREVPKVANKTKGANNGRRNRSKSNG